MFIRYTSFFFEVVYKIIIITVQKKLHFITVESEHIDTEMFQRHELMKKLEAEADIVVKVSCPVIIAKNVFKLFLHGLVNDQHVDIACRKKKRQSVSI